MIQAKCASCGKQYSLPDQAAGKKAKCKACGAVMAIPKPGAAAAVSKPPPADDPLGLGGPPDKSKGDLSSLYGQAGGDPVASPTTEPAGFNPAVSFSTTATKKSSASLPLGLILGVGGGAVGLILVVIIAIVVMGNPGGDDSDNSSAGGLSLGGGSVPGSSAADDDTPADGEAANGQGSKDQAQTRISPPPKEQDLEQWTNTDPVSKDWVDYVSFRGVAFPLREGWTAETKTMTYHMRYQAETMMADPIKAYGDRYEDIGVVQVDVPAASEKVRVELFFMRRGTQGDWPAVYAVSQITSKLVLGSDIYAQYVNSEKKNGHDPTFNGTRTVSMERAGKSHKTPAAFPVFLPNRFYVLKDRMKSSSSTKPVQYGTLFGGHRFLRIDQTDDFTKERHLIYSGFLGDMQVTAAVELKPEQLDMVDQIEQMIRSGVLLTEEMADPSSEDDPVYTAWAKDPGFDLVYADQRVAWLQEGGLATVTPDTPGLLSPTGQKYGLVVPESLEVVSTTRVAIRTEPLADGTWLSMEVHKLAGLQRRQASPLTDTGQAILMRGRIAPIPDGVERSELDDDAYTIHRLLYPKTSGQTTRRVVYIVKDKAYLITLFGNVPVDNPDRLAEFDAAAMSLQTMPDPPAEEWDEIEDWEEDEESDEDE